MDSKILRLRKEQYLDFDRLITLNRHLAGRMLRMRQRKLRNGILVNYTFDHKYSCPHFEFFSYDLSDTGYRCDFFGYGLTLTKEDVPAAFDIRANMHCERHQKWMKKRDRDAVREQRRKEKAEKEKRESRIVQLTMGF